MFYHYYRLLLTDSNTNTINDHPSFSCFWCFYVTPSSVVIYLFCWHLMLHQTSSQQKLLLFFSLVIYFGFLCLICWHAYSPGFIQLFRRSCEINRPSETKQLFIFFSTTSPLILFEMVIYLISLLMVLLSSDWCIVLSSPQVIMMIELF